jgi:hypothetical protein
MKLARYVAYRILIEKYETREILRNLGIDGRIILKLILNKWCLKLWIRFIYLGGSIVRFVVVVMNQKN